jgi:hypothetical protein
MSDFFSCKNLANLMKVVCALIGIIGFFTGKIPDLSGVAGFIAAIYAPFATIDASQIVKTAKGQTSAGRAAAAEAVANKEAHE